MLEIGAEAARRRLPELLDRAHAGESSIIKKRGIPYAALVPLEQRMEMLKALRCVDIVHPYDELEYVSGCKELKADIFVIGEDWGNKPHNVAVESYLKLEGKQINQVLYNPRTSSTRIKQNVMAQSCNENNVKLAFV